MKFKSGVYIQNRGYKIFQPEKLMPGFVFNEPDIAVLLEKANIKLGELNAYSELVPDVNHFIRLHVVKEATVSSKIEGTQTKMGEALLHEEEIEPEKRSDWREVNNYINAMNESIEMLKTLPISTRLLKQAHKTLLSGVRGSDKLPGEFRRSQNWIGGATLNDATFIPPLHQEIDALMGDLENFLHSDNTGLPHVIKIAIAHYQFETIHPFLDGNGRIGRLMITLYFMQAGIMNQPVLYLSDFFERHRQLYYDHLTSVRINNDILQWIKFFLVGVVETCERAITGLRNIIKLKKDCETNLIPQLGKKMKVAQALLLHLFNNPFIRPKEVAEVTGLSQVSAYALIEDFERLGILVQFGDGQRNRIYYFSQYYAVFDGN